MKARHAVIDRDLEYGRDVRAAGVVSLAAVILVFLFVPQPEVKPYQLSGILSDTNWVRLDTALVKIDVPKPPKPQGQVVPAKGGEPSVPTIDPNTSFPDITLPVDEPKVEPIVFWKVEKKPVLVHQVVPAYPDMARMAGIEGKVVVSIVVDTLGAVAGAEVMASSGNGQIDEAALAAAREFRFTPGYQRDRPVPVLMSVPFKFSLE
jgi:TonB family protein